MSPSVQFTFYSRVLGRTLSCSSHSIELNHECLLLRRVLLCMKDMGDHCNVFLTPIELNHGCLSQARFLYLMNNTKDQSIFSPLVRSNSIMNISFNWSSSLEWTTREIYLFLFLFDGAQQWMTAHVEFRLLSVCDWRLLSCSPDRLHSIPE